MIWSLLQIPRPFWKPILTTFSSNMRGLESPSMGSLLFACCSRREIWSYPNPSLSKKSLVRIVSKVMALIQLLLSQILVMSCFNIQKVTLLKMKSTAAWLLVFNLWLFDHPKTLCWKSIPLQNIQLNGHLTGWSVLFESLNISSLHRDFLYILTWKIDLRNRLRFIPSWTLVGTKLAVSLGLDGWHPPIIFYSPGTATNKLS